MKKSSKKPKSAQRKKPVRHAGVAKKNAVGIATNTPSALQKQPMVQFASLPDGKKRVLHVGCGSKEKGYGLHKTFKTSEWHEVRLDIDAVVKPDILSDMMDMYMIPDASVEAIWSSHNIEHVWSHQVPIVLKEFARVLKPNGFVLLATPDTGRVAEAICKKGLEAPLYHSPSGDICAIDILYGHRGSLQKGYHFMGHKMGFTAQTLGRKLKESGLLDVRVQRDGYHLNAIAYKRLEKTEKNQKLTILDEDINEMMLKRDHLDKEPEQQYNLSGLRGR